MSVNIPLLQSARSARTHRNRRPKPTPSLWGKLGSRNNVFHLLNCADERDQDLFALAISTLARAVSKWPYPVGSAIQCTWRKQSVTGRSTDTRASLRFIIQCWRSGIRTMGDTPRAAMAGTASCMAASGCCSSDANKHHQQMPLVFPTVNIPMLAIDHDPFRPCSGQDPRDIRPRNHLPYAHRRTLVGLEGLLQPVGLEHCGMGGHGSRRQKADRWGA